jgi:hypothetical protein
MKELPDSFALFLHQLGQLGDGHDSTVVLTTHVDDAALPRSSHDCKRTAWSLKCSTQASFFQLQYIGSDSCCYVFQSIRSTDAIAIRQSQSQPFWNLALQNLSVSCPSTLAADAVVLTIVLYSTTHNQHLLIQLQPAAFQHSSVAYLRLQLSWFSKGRCSAHSCLS